MIRPGKFLLYPAACVLVLLYLASDLFIFKGPLRRMIDHAAQCGEGGAAAAKAGDVVARVFDHQITRSQLERAVRERLWLEGKTPEALSPGNRKIVRCTVLNELIDHELLRIKVKAHASELTVSDEEINERLNGFSSRFESPETMEKAMKSQGVGTLRDLRDRLTARIQQEKYVESQIGSIARVTEEEAKKWYDENQKHLAIPERVEVRHIFIATLDRPAEEAKAALDAALADLTSKKKDFATLARELSEDSANNEAGGALGWMTRDRLPADFGTPVFSLPLKQPALVRTKLGWHLVEVTARKATEVRTYEDAKAEVISALEGIKRRQVCSNYRDHLRLSEQDEIEVFSDMMGE